MGQSSSSSGNSPNLDNHDLLLSRRFVSDSTATILPMMMSNESFESFDDVEEGRDYTFDLPDECLGNIFQSLSAGERKQCSLVCRRWSVVEGQTRQRLSLNAQYEIVPHLPSLFNRFDSITKLALRSDRRSVSINDDGLVLISIRCPNLIRLKLRGCREVTEVGMAKFAKNCKGLKKLSCGSCIFGAKGMNAVLNHCSTLEELSVKRLRGIHESGAAAFELIGPGIASSSLKSLSLKELCIGQSFEPLIIASKKLRTLKLFRCLGDWDKLFETIGTENPSLIEVHLERLQVSDIGLSGISNCSNLEVLHIVKTPDCTNLGLIKIAEHCKLLRKLHIDGWRTNRIGDEGLNAIAKHCPNLQELVLIGVNPSSTSLTAIASNCRNLERLALCGSDTIGDAEILSIAAKCVALRKLCIKGCPISDHGMETLAWGFPNLVKVKIKKCLAVTSGIGTWLRVNRRSLIVALDAAEFEAIDADGSEFGAQDNNAGTQELELVDEVAIVDGRSPLLKAKSGLLAGIKFIANTLRKWSNSNSSNLTSIPS